MNTQNQFLDETVFYDLNSPVFKSKKYNFSSLKSQESTS